MLEGPSPPPSFPLRIAPFCVILTFALSFANGVSNASRQTCFLFYLHLFPSECASTSSPWCNEESSQAPSPLPPSPSPLSPSPQLP